jgi:glucan phosphoethanolaminetransferase (alkaline phosphatase superfamily)
VPELERRLKIRRRQTALIAYATFVLASIFLAAWVCEALSSPWTAARVALALEFLPFCALFFLLAFYNALLNFQIRIGRAASWREFLATSEPFWPR